MIERHIPDVKVVGVDREGVDRGGVDRGGVGTKHRKCFFHGRDQIIKNITLNYTVLLKGNFSIKYVIIKFFVVQKL